MITKKIFLAIIVALISSTLDAKTRSCKSFADWQEAQAYFKAKKKGYKSLDRNKDGIACNGLKASEGKRHQLKIYKNGHANGYGQIFATKKACQKEASKFSKNNKALDLSYKCIKK